MAEYAFVEAEDGSFPDSSGTGESLPLHLYPADTDRQGGVTVNPPPQVLRSEGRAAKIIEALRETAQLSLEVWLQPASLAQHGPARIVSLSANTGDDRNFTLGQEGSRYAFRLRTATEQVDTGFRVTELATPDGAVRLEVHQVLVTYEFCPHCGAGTFRAFVDGECLVERSDVRGDFSTWLDDLPLLVANEFSLDRTWRGRVFGIAIYNRALSAEEALANYSAGPPAQE